MILNKRMRRKAIEMPLGMEEDESNLQGKVIQQGDLGEAVESL